MFYELEMTTQRPVDPKKLDKVEHHLCVDGAGRIWQINARGAKFSYTEGDGDRTTLLHAPDIAPITTKVNVIWYAPCENGFIVESSQYGVLRVSTEAILALREPGEYNVNALAVDMQSGEFSMFETLSDQDTYAMDYVLLHYAPDGALIAAHDPAELTGSKVNTGHYNVALALDAHWLAFTIQRELFVLARHDAQRSPAVYDYEGDERLHLDGDTLWSIGSNSVHRRDLRSGEASQHPMTSLVDGSVGITGIDFVSKLVIMKENNGDQRCRLARFDASGSSLHPFDEVVRTKRLKRCYGLHMDAQHRLWLAAGRGNSTRFVILDEKGKNAKFQNPV